MINKWDLAHMKVAEVYADLSTARRAHVGCVIVKDNRIISIGYNGMPSGWDNDCEVEHIDYLSDRMPRKELRTKPEVLHAETNAIAKVARSSESCHGATLYVTMAPCLDCAKLIYQSGIHRVVYRNDYPKGDAGLTFLRKCNMLVERL